MAKHVTGAKGMNPQTRIQMIYDAEPTKEAAVAKLAAPFYNGDALHDLLILKGAQTVMSSCRHSDNAKIFRGDPSADVTQPRSWASTERLRVADVPIISLKHKARIKRTVEVLQLLAVVLPNGTKMANAKRADLEDAANRMGAQGRDMLHKATFYRAVMTKLPAGKVVEDVFDDMALSVMFKQYAPSETQKAA